MANLTTNVHDIEPATAKRMVDSYQTSMSSETAIRVLTFNANEIRNYLSNTAIENFAVFLSHTEDLANSNYGQQNNSAITVVLVGTDSNGNAVKSVAHGFLDYADPCPTNCTNYSSPTFWD